MKGENNDCLSKLKFLVVGKSVRVNDHPRNISEKKKWLKTGIEIKLIEVWKLKLDGLVEGHQVNNEYFWNLDFFSSGESWLFYSMEEKWKY